MKIAVITVYDSNNFGSFLQAYALKTYLEKLGHDVYFVKFRSEYEVKRLFGVESRKIFNKIRAYQKYNAFYKDRNCFKEIDITQISNMDKVVIGSDEVWNIKKKTFQNELFYGDIGDVNVPVVYYGISTGDATLKDFLNKESIIDRIKLMSNDELLLRDVYSNSVIKEITGMNYKQVLDPTFLIEKDYYSSGVDIKYSKKYILIYTYGLNEKEVLYVKRFAKEHNLEIVSVCMKYKWADKNINCGPMLFSKWIEHATYVVTSTFHGTIFSILNKKAFISIAKNPKISNLLDLLGVNEVKYIEGDYSEFCKILLSDKKYVQVFENINRLKKDTLEITKNVF